MKIAGKTAYALPASLLVLQLAACSSYKVYATDSLPAVKEIRIDGKTEDWLGALSIIEDRSVLVGFQNDRESLYVCLIVEGESLQAQIMGQGLTLWFDPRGGKTKAMGIRYPLGMAPRKMPEEQSGEPSPPSPEDFSEEALSTLEIIESQKEPPQKMEIAAARGIEIKAVPIRNLFVYELKIPLLQTESHPFAVGAQPGQTIGIGFETPKPDQSQMAGPPSGGMPEGGGRRPPMGGGGVGRGGAPSRGMMGEMPRGLRVWALVHLSSGDTDGPAKLLSTSKIATSM
jgi:hypothetical protein